VLAQDAIPQSILVLLAAAEAAAITDFKSQTPMLMMVALMVAGAALAVTAKTKKPTSKHLGMAVMEEVVLFALYGVLVAPSLQQTQETYSNERNSN
jgi:cytochrome bd-type quinol oxidase subunit 2